MREAQAASIRVCRGRKETFLGSQRHRLGEEIPLESVLTMQNNNQFVALISGGKDSFHSILHSLALGYSLGALCNLTPVGSKETKFDGNEQIGSEINKEENAELDSFMFQTVGYDLIDAYPKVLSSIGVLERALDLKNTSEDLLELLKTKELKDQIPLFRAQIRGSSKKTGSSYYPDKNLEEEDTHDEVEDLFDILSRIKEQCPGMAAVSCGAILSNYQRVRVENVCERLNLKLLAPLWRMDQHHLMAEMIESGLHSIIIKVACLGLNNRDLGKPLSIMYPKLLDLHKKYGCNVCGEGGEFETITLDSPVFIRKISIKDTQIIEHSDDYSAPVSYLRFNNYEIENKFDFNSLSDIENWRSQLIKSVNALRDRYSLFLEKNTTSIILSHDLERNSDSFLSNLPSSFLLKNSTEIKRIFSKVTYCILDSLKSDTNDDIRAKEPLLSSTETGTLNATANTASLFSPVRERRCSREELPSLKTNKDLNTEISKLSEIEENISLQSSLNMLQIANNNALNNVPLVPGDVQQGWQGSLPFVGGGNFISITGITINSLSGGARRYPNITISQETEALLSYLLAQLDRPPRLRHTVFDNQRAILALNPERNDLPNTRDDPLVARVVTMFVSLKDMNNFAEFNKVYKSFFSSDSANIYGNNFSYVANNCSPPVRVCISSNLDSPSNVQIDCLAVLEPRSSSTNKNEGTNNLLTEFMHVQSISYWAPANIGPYSQTSILKPSNEIVAAGQIGLVPYQMELPKAGGILPNGISSNVVSLINGLGDSPEFNISESARFDFKSSFILKTICSRINLLVELSNLYLETLITLQNFSQVIFGALNPSESTVIPQSGTICNLDERSYKNRAAMVITFLRNLLGGVIMLSSNRLSSVRNSFIESDFTFGGRRGSASSFLSNNTHSHNNQQADSLAISIIHCAIKDHFTPSKQMKCSAENIKTMIDLLTGSTNNTFDYKPYEFEYTDGNKSLNFNNEDYDLEDLLLLDSVSNSYVHGGWKKENFVQVYKSYVDYLMNKGELPITVATASMLPKDAFIELCFSFSGNSSLIPNISKYSSGLSSKAIEQNIHNGLIKPVIENFRGQVSFTNHAMIPNIGILKSDVKITINRNAPILYSINLSLNIKSSTSANYSLSTLNDDNSAQKVYLGISQLIGQQVNKIIKEYFIPYYLSNDELLIFSETGDTNEDLEPEDIKVKRLLNYGIWTHLSEKGKLKDSYNKPKLTSIGRGTAIVDPELRGIHNVQVFYRVKGACGVSGAHIAASLQTPLNHSSTIEVESIEEGATIVAILPLATSYVGVDDLLSFTGQPEIGIVSLMGRISGTW